MPTPHVKEWKKETSFGDYKDPKQNFKFSSKNCEQYNLVHRRARLGGKHSGSKKLHTLKMYN